MVSKLSKDEKELLDSFEKGEWKSVLTESRKKKIKEAAKKTFAKDRRVNIRISSKDVELIQERALIEGIPYQTLMSSVLHKYVNGRLVERAHNKASKKADGETAA